MDQSKHENWTYFGSHDDFSTLQIWCGSSNSLCDRRQFSILGQNFLRYSTICEQFIKYDTQNLESPQEEEDVPASSEVVAARSKAKAKPQPRESTGTTTIPLSERVWIDIEPSKQDLESHNLSKKVINLLRHNQRLHREQDGAIHFYKIKFHLWDYSIPIQELVGQSMVSLFGCRRRTQTKISVLLWLFGINHLSPCSSRTFWGQSRWSCVTRQCIGWTWDISIHLSRRKQFQS